jgi:hypothetical protein
MDSGASWGPAVAASVGTVLATYRPPREESRRVEARWVFSANGGGTFTLAELPVPDAIELREEPRQ